MTDEKTLLDWTRLGDDVPARWLAKSARVIDGKPVAFLAIDVSEWAFGKFSQTFVVHPQDDGRLAPVRLSGGKLVYRGKANHSFMTLDEAMAGCEETERIWRGLQPPPEWWLSWRGTDI